MQITSSLIEKRRDRSSAASRCSVSALRFRPPGAATGFLGLVRAWLELRAIPLETDAAAGSGRAVNFDFAAAASGRRAEGAGFEPLPLLFSRTGFPMAASLPCARIPRDALPYSLRMPGQRGLNSGFFYIRHIPAKKSKHQYTDYINYIVADVSPQASFFIQTGSSAYIRTISLSLSADLSDFRFHDAPGVSRHFWGGSFLLACCR